MSKMLGESNKQQLEEHLPLEELLIEYHDIFCLEDERGETNLVEFEIDTGDESPRKQPVRRTPFAARKEIAKSAGEDAEKWSDYTIKESMVQSGSAGE